MYADHMPPIRDAMRADYQVFQRGILFVICSIRQPIIVVPEARKRLPAYRRKVARYVQDIGGKAREYWDAWCTDVAGRYKKTADEISALHLAIVPNEFVPF